MAFTYNIHPYSLSTFNLTIASILTTWNSPYRKKKCQTFSLGQGYGRIQVFKLMKCEPQINVPIASKTSITAECEIVTLSSAKISRVYNIGSFIKTFCKPRMVAATKGTECHISKEKTTSNNNNFANDVSIWLVHPHRLHILHDKFNAFRINTNIYSSRFHKSLHPSCLACNSKLLKFIIFYWIVCSNFIWFKLLDICFPRFLSFFPLFSLSRSIFDYFR